MCDKAGEGFQVSNGEGMGKAWERRGEGFPTLPLGKAWGRLLFSNTLCITIKTDSVPSPPSPIHLPHGKPPVRSERP